MQIQCRLLKLILCLSFDADCINKVESNLKENFMGAKRFGAVLANPGIPAIVMSGEAGKDKVAVLSIANQGTSQTAIYIAYLDSTNIANISNEDYLVFNRTLAVGDRFELKGIAIGEGCSISVLSMTTIVSAVAFGMESSSV
jgi:hypothetical protein